MKILHTSDWHLGRMLYAKKDRQEEHAAFLAWLLHLIKEQSIDMLLIVGDVFDNASPSSAVQKMYYDFLVNVKKAGCQQVVVVGGNHDSPSFLNAPKVVLAALDVTVIGNAGETVEDEIVVVNDQNAQPVAIVCAVPFLRERDINRFVEGENYADRSRRINENIKKHYEDIAQLAEEKRKTIGRAIPIIATGHLSVAGGKRNDDDGVRETYIGTIEAVGSDIFPDTFEYVALGHYHIPSVIKHHIRYCGSPIPMGFGEAEQTKVVYVISLDNIKTVDAIKIPVFQRLVSISGDKDYLATRLKELRDQNESVWLEMIYTGNEVFPHLTAWANEQTKNSFIEILKLQNRQTLNDVLTKNDVTDSLDDLNPLEVFDKLLEKSVISDQQKDELKTLYREVVVGLTVKENEG
jgi:exonuclease SbcD